jgi:RNA polymerase sigma-70 factor (ECF subfamily)
LQEDLNTGTTSDIDLLIDRAVNGSADDFGRLYDLHVERVYRHIYYRVGNTGDAEDLTQQVFLKAWKAIGKYKKTASPFLAWLMRISHNLVIDFYRSKKDTAFIENELLPADKAPGPQQLAEKQYEQERLRKVIMKLPEEQQQVILMSFIEGFNHREIAAALGKKEGNIRVMIHRALKKMRKIMDTEKHRS